MSGWITWVVGGRHVEWITYPPDTHPQPRTHTHHTNTRHTGVFRAKDPTEAEEERRLFYVAMTRAKQHLILTLARVRRIYGTDFLAEPSSFLHDIDGGLMQVEQGEEGYERIIHI